MKAISAHPDNVEHFTNAAIVLHNFLIHEEPKYLRETSYGDRISANGEVMPGDWRFDTTAGSCFKDLAPKSGSNSSTEAKSIRDTFSTYFNNEGEVPWQSSIVDDDGRR